MNDGDESCDPVVVLGLLIVCTLQSKKQIQEQASMTSPIWRYVVGNST
jgi:hypothetical protein